MPPRTPAPRLTHFLCIPLVTATSHLQLSASLSAFRADPLNSTIPRDAIRPLGTLHLTLGVMSLLTPARIAGALNLLQSLDIGALLSTATLSDQTPSAHEASQDAASGQVMSGKEAADGESRAAHPHPKVLDVTLRGLVSMHDPASTSILYAAPIDPDKQLQRFCESLKDIFGRAGFLVADSRPLLLHATMVNTVYVPGVRKGGSGHGKRKARLTMDVRDVVERYGDMKWMEGCRVEKVAVCRMGAKEDAETGEEKYVIEGEVDVPV